jgi:hypothetical protein
MDMFLSMLWYVKDCAVSLQGLTWYTPDVNHNLNERVCYAPYYTASGGQNPTYFTLDELREAQEFYDKFQLLCPHFRCIPPKDEDVVDKEYIGGISPGFLHNHNDLTRIERAVMFLDTARTQYHLPSRIAFYVPMFEALFTASSGGEIAHTVSERVAFYLEDDPFKIKEVYSLLKVAYDIRSRFFHGDVLKPKHSKQNSLVEISEKVDAIARKVLRKVLLEDAHIFQKSKNDLEVYLADIIFKLNSSNSAELQ